MAGFNNQYDSQMVGGDASGVLLKINRSAERVGRFSQEHIDNYSSNHRRHATHLLYAGIFDSS
jgi:hypothetical protein